MTTSRQTCSRHRRDPEPGYCATCARMKVEHKIVMHTVRAFVSKGWEIAVNDGEETTLDYTGDKAAIEEALFTTGEDYLLLRKRGEKGWVRFIYGNSGPDVCNDYTINLEPIMEKVNAFADRQTPHDG